MGDFKIKTTLDLDTGDAEQKINSLGKDGVKTELKVNDKAFQKSIKDFRKGHIEATKDSNKISSGVFKNNMDKELKSYRKLLNNKKNLEREYLRTSNSNRKNAIEKELEVNKKAIKKAYGEIRDNAFKNNDGRKIQALNTLTTSFLGKDPFGGSRSAKEMLEQMKQVDTIARNSRDMFNQISGTSSKKLAEEHKKQNDSILKRVKDASLNDSNAEKYERRAKALNKLAQQSLEVDKKERAFNDMMHKQRVKAGKIENDSLKEQAFKRLNDIQQKKENMSLKVHPNDISNSFSDLNKELSDYSGNLSGLSKESKKIENAHKKELTGIEKQGENIKSNIKNFSTDLSKDIAKNLNIEEQVGNLLGKARKKEHNPNALSDYSKKLEGYEGQTKKLKQVDSLGEKVNQNLKKSKSILGSYLDDNVNKKAEKMVGSIEGMYKKIDKKNPDNALRGLKQLDERLSNIKKTKKQLDTMDNMSFKIKNSDNVSDSDKRRILSSLYSKGFGKIGTESFKPQMRLVAEEMKQADIIGRQNISSQKKYTRELDNTVAKARTLKSTLKETDGALSTKYKGRLENDIDNFIQANERKSGSKQNLVSVQNGFNALNKQKTMLNNLNRLESQIEGKYSKTQYKLQTVSNEATVARANQVGVQLRKAYSNLDGGNLKNTYGNLKKFNSELGRTSTIAQQLVKHDNSINKLSAYEHTLKPREVNKFRKELVSLANSDNLGKPQFEARLKGLNTEMTALSRYRSTLGQFKQDFKASFMGTSLGMFAGEQIRKVVTGAIESYKGLDDSMINIKKVADEKDIRTVGQIKAITKNAIATAKEVGASSTDVQNAIATSLQSGMGGMKASMAVARKAMILSNIGDMNKEDATKSINTIVKSFNLNPLKKARIEVKGITKETTELNNALDMINHAGNNFAISESGVVEALQQGGGVLHSYGVSLADSIALVTTANEPLQDPKKVGNGLKSIAINFAGMSASAKDGSLKLNKTAMALQGIADIDIYSDKKTGQIKSMVQILDELQPKWKNLRDDERKSLSEAIAGKHRANVFQALMQNYDTFKAMRSQFSEGEHFGSAEEENARFVNSIGGKVNKLKETATSIVSTIVNSKGVYGFLDVLNASAGGFERLIGFADKHNAQLPTLVGGMLALKAVYKGFKGEVIDWGHLIDKYEKSDSIPKKRRKGIGSYLSKSDKAGGLKFSSIQPLDKESSELKKAKNSRDKYNKSYKETGQIIESNQRIEKKKPKGTKSDHKTIDKTTDSLRKNSREVGKTSEAIREMSKTSDDAIEKTSTFGQKLDSQANKIKGKLQTPINKTKEVTSAIGGLAKGALKGIASTVTGIGVSMAGVWLVSKALGGVKKWYDNKSHSIENSKREHLENREALIKENKAMSNNIDFVKKNANAINSLAQRKRALTSVPEKERSQDQIQELEKLRALESQVAKISPQSIVGYDKNGDPILNANLNAEKLLKTLELVQNQKKKALANTDKAIYDDNVNQVKNGETFGKSTLDKIELANKTLNERFRTSNKALGSSKRQNELPDIIKNNQNLKNYADEYAKIINDFDKAKDVEVASNKFKEQMGKWRKNANSEFKKLNSAVKEYDKFNQENTSLQLNALDQDTRFQRLGKSTQEATKGLAGLFQWGKIDNPKFAMGALMNLSEKVSPAKIASITQELNDLNQAYHMDKDYETYSKGIDTLAKKFGRLAGMASSGEISKIKEAMKDVNRGFESFDDMQESKYMKRHGAKNSDLLKDNADAMYATKVKERYSALKSAHNDLLNATSLDEKRNAVEMLGYSPYVSKGQGELARSALKVKNATNETYGAVEKLTRAFLTLDPTTEDTSKGLDKLYKTLDSGVLDGAIDLGEGIKLGVKDIQELLRMDVNSSTLKDGFGQINKQLYQNVEDFYSNYKDSKGKKIEIPVDVKMKLADDGLSEKDLKGLERVVEGWGLKDEQANAFRRQAGKFFEASNGDTELVYKRMADDSKSMEGLRTAIEFGMESKLTSYNDKIQGLANSYHQLTDSMKENANAMEDVDYNRYLQDFGALSERMKYLAINKNVESADQMSGLRNTYDMFSDQGFNDVNATKMVNVMVNTIGIDNLNTVTQALEGLPEEYQTNIVAKFSGENGEDFIQGFNNLVQASGGDSEIMSMVIKTHLEKGEGWDWLSQYSQGDAQGEVSNFTVKANVEASEAEQKKEELSQDQQSNIDVSLNSGNAQGEKEELTKDEQAFIDMNVNSGNALSEKRELAKDEQANVNFTGNTADAKGKKEELKQDTQSTHTVNLKMPKVDINIFPSKSKEITLTAKDQASASAKQATSAVNSFPKDNKTVTLIAVNNASANALAATMAVNAFPTGTRTCYLTTVYSTLGSPPSGASFYGRKSIKIDPDISDLSKKKLKALKEHRLPRLQTKMLMPKHTQMNPMVGSPVGGGAGATAGGGINTAGDTITGGVASSEPKKYTFDNLLLAINNFRHLSSDLEYRWLTAIKKVTYSANEMADAFKYNVDIIKTAEFALKRIDNSIRGLNIRVQTAVGSRKASLLNLQNDELREKIRRLDTLHKQVEDRKLYHRSDAKRLGVKFSPKNEIPENLAEIAIKLKKEAEQLDKKLEKEKNENKKKKLNEQKKQNERDQKTLEELEKNSLKQQEIFNQKLEAQNQIAKNEDDIRKDKIKAWKEYYATVEKLMDNTTKGISRNLDVINIKMKNAFGIDKIRLMTDQVSMQEKMLSQLDETSAMYKDEAESIQSYLIRDFGFTFKDGKIVNLEGTLAKLRETSTMYNEAKEMAYKYVDLTDNKLKENEKSHEEYNQKIKNSMRDRLTATKTIEDKIVKLYKKQLDEQIKGLEKVNELRNEEIKKKKEAYQLARKEADFQDDLNKKKKELEELELKRDILSRDFSQKGQKEKQKVEKEIEKKSEEITHLTNRYFDDLILKSFDDESKKNSEKIKNEREKREEKYSDDQLLKLAQESIQSGILIGINGEKDQKLEKALEMYLNRYEGGLGATGSIIKGETFANLDIAINTISQFSTVLSRLGSSNFGTGEYIQGVQYKEVQAEKDKYKNEINYNSPLISVEGVGAKDIAKEIKPFIKEIMDEQLKTLTGNIR